MDFYNQRRRQLQTVQPNKAHFNLKELEKKYAVSIITQNVDNLHERAESKNIIHLHGELLKVRSTSNPALIYEWDNDLVLGDVCEEKSQLRPHIVWFGEEVPLLEKSGRNHSTSRYFSSYWNFYASISSCKFNQLHKTKYSNIFY